MSNSAYYNDFKNCAELSRAVTIISKRIRCLDIRGRTLKDGSKALELNRKLYGDYKVKYAYLVGLLKERYPSKYKKHIKAIESKIKLRAEISFNKLNISCKNDNLHREQEVQEFKGLREGDRAQEASGQIQGGSA